MEQRSSRTSVRIFVVFAVLLGFFVATSSRSVRAQENPKPDESASAKPAAPATAAPKDKDPKAPAAPADDEEDDTIAPPKDRKGEVHKIGLVITNLVKIDQVKNLFEFEGQLTISTKGHIPKCDKKKIEQLFDGEVKKAEEIGEHTDESGMKHRTCKVAVEIADDIDIKKFPFDVQELDIAVGDVGDAIEGVQYEVDKEGSGLGEKATLPGWDIEGMSADTIKVKEPSEHKEVTVAHFSVTAKRPRLAAFIKGLLAVCFQLMIGLVAILLKVKNITNRISMATGALIAVAATHNSVSSSLGVAYLTTADKFFMSSYFLLLLNIGFSVLMLRAEDNKNEAGVAKLHKTSLWVLPIATIICTAVALLT